MKNKIADLISRRKCILDSQRNDDSESVEEEKDKRIDEMGDEIDSLLKTHRKELEVDFIIDSLTCLGECPSLLYDDDGHFALTSDGSQSMSLTESPHDMDMVFWVKKEQWKDTIREALNHYLDQGGD